MELKLFALDRDDLEVVSTHVQESVVSVSDIHWRPTEKRLLMLINRFDWEEAQCDSPQYHRRRTALRFDRVTACRCRNIACKDKSTILNLLAVDFVATTGPAGVVTLTFSGDMALRLEVECLEAELADLGPVWETTVRPVHSDDAGHPAA